MVFHGFWLVSMIFQGGFMVFHGLLLVLGWFSCFSWFQIGFSWFLMVPGWFFMVFHGFRLVFMVFLENVPPQTVSWPNNPV